MIGSRISWMVWRGRQFGRIVQCEDRAVGLQHLVDDGRRRADQVEVVLALQTLLDDVHVQQAEKAAAKAESHRLGALRLEMQCRVVELELVEGLAQRRIVLGIDRKQAGKDARLDFLESRQRMRGGIGIEGQGVADRRAMDFLDRRCDPAHFAAAELVLDQALGREHADLIDFVPASGRHHQDLVLRLDLALHDAHQRNDAEVVVEPRIDDQGLQLVGIPRPRRRNAGDDRLEYIDDVEAGLGADRDRIFGVDADDGLDFVLGPLDIGGRQIDLVQHRDHGQALLDRGIAVGDRLRFDALCRIDDQQRALAGGQRTAHLVGKIDMSRACR